MSAETYMICDRCGLREPAHGSQGWMWAQRSNGVADRKDICPKCVSEIFPGRAKYEKRKMTSASTFDR